MAGLPWVRLDTTFYENPKILALLAERDGYRAAVVYVSALAYAGGHGTDGHIATYVLSRVHGRKADADRLVRHGLFEAADGGWQIHDYEQMQQTSDTTASIRAERRRASIKGNCIRHHGEDCGCWNEHLRAVPRPSQLGSRLRSHKRLPEGIPLVLRRDGTGLHEELLQLRENAHGE